MGGEGQYARQEGLECHTSEKYGRKEDHPTPSYFRSNPVNQKLHCRISCISSSLCPPPSSLLFLSHSPFLSLSVSLPFTLPFLSSFSPLPSTILSIHICNLFLFFRLFTFLILRYSPSYHLLRSFHLFLNSSFLLFLSFTFSTVSSPSPSLPFLLLPSHSCFLPLLLCSLSASGTPRSGPGAGSLFQLAPDRQSQSYFTLSGFRVPSR